MEFKNNATLFCEDKGIPDCFYRIFEKAKQDNASDIHLSSGLKPVLRINGELKNIESLENIVISDELIKAFCLALKVNLKLGQSQEFLIDNLSHSRFRASVFTQHGGLAMVLRLVSVDMPDLDSINAPDIFKSLLQHQQGLILLTGSTGSGKTTTLAAMITYLNQNFRKHIMSLEDPIEFVHKSDKCLIHQRQVGRDCRFFNTALVSALRQDPDIILIGEMRDEDTVRLALRAAETGHLVLTTLHTQSAAKAINRIVDNFSASQQEAIRAQLAQTLLASIWQQLFKTGKNAPHNGRIAAWEVLINNNAVANMIRHNKIEQITSIQQSSGKVGMQTMEQALNRLIAQGWIESER